MSLSNICASVMTINILQIYPLPLSGALRDATLPAGVAVLLEAAPASEDEAEVEADAEVSWAFSVTTCCSELRSSSLVFCCNVFWVSSCFFASNSWAWRRVTAWDYTHSPTALCVYGNANALKVYTLHTSIVRPRACLCATSCSSLVFIDASCVPRFSILLFSCWRASVSICSVVN